MLRRGRPRTVLISLLLQAGQAVRADVLIEHVWGDDLPSNALNALQVHVSYLRRTLGLAADGEAPALRTVAGGYLIDVSDECLDVHRFERDIARAAQELAQPSREGAEAALVGLREALSLWRGDPLQDVAYNSFAIAEIERLHELRASALEYEIDALLALGKHDATVPALRRLIADFPLRERFRAQLVLALYRSGRQAEALRAFDAARYQLVEELGVEPGHDLEELQHAVLDHDAALDWVPLAGSGDEAPTTGVDLVAVADRPGRRRPTPVPTPNTRLVGRERELVSIRETMAENRLVTLVGPGGAGKSRLALELAHGDAERPVWMVELSEVSDGDVVPFEIARAIGVASSNDPIGNVTLSIGSQPGLLVLDTCEHQLDACATAAHRLLRSCPRLGILATSRQPLGVVGEVAWPVAPLALPAQGAALADLRAAAAVDLFSDRARAARPDFALDDSNADAVANICRTVDGLPLAIELAAARVSVLSPAAILERLDDRFALLSRVGRAAELRQQSLLAAVEWSDDLLDDDQRIYFYRLGVFAGRFTLEAASAVAGDGLASDPLDLLSAMVDRSLVVAQGDDSYRMLDSLRAYAADALGRDARQSSSAHRRLATWLAQHVETADTKLRGPDQQATLDRLRGEVPNLRAALQWCLTGGDPQLGARLERSLWWFWAFEGASSDVARWLKDALAVPDLDSETRAGLLQALGRHALALGDVARAQRALQEATDLWDELGMPERGAIGLVHLGVTHRWFGRFGAAAASQDRAIALARDALRRLGGGLDTALAGVHVGRSGRRRPARRRRSRNRGAWPPERAIRTSWAGSPQSSPTPSCERVTSTGLSIGSTTLSPCSSPPDGTRVSRSPSPRWAGPWSRVAGSMTRSSLIDERCGSQLSSARRTRSPRRSKVWRKPAQPPETSKPVPSSLVARQRCDPGWRQRSLPGNGARMSTRWRHRCASGSELLVSRRLSGAASGWHPVTSSRRSTVPEARMSSRRLLRRRCSADGLHADVDPDAATHELPAAVEGHVPRQTPIRTVDHPDR